MTPGEGWRSEWVVAWQLFAYLFLGVFASTVRGNEALPCKRR